VRYAGGGSYVLRQRWERRNGGWKTVDVEPPSVKPPLWKRIFRRG
jgi:hypothetical protein